MPLLVTKATVDTQSVDGNCTYPPKALGGTPIPTNVYINKQQVQMYTSATVLDTVEGVKINPAPAPCIPGVRTIQTTVNQSVYINKQKPAVQGDQAALVGTARPLTGPFSHPTVIIGSRG